MNAWPPLGSVSLHEDKGAFYRGEVRTAPASAPSSRLCALLRGLARDELGGRGLRDAHLLGSQGLYEALTRARAAVASSEQVWAHAGDVARALGARDDAWVLDQPRLRAVGSGLWRDPRARRAYMTHRDTWYASPRAQVNIWIPLLDVGPTEGFAVYPGWFDAPIENDSGSFDYARWAAAVGFQSSAPAEAEAFPESSVVLSPRHARRVRARAGQVVVFSGAHLHATMGHDSGRTRWSVDMRLVCLDDARAGLGAPDPDNLSRGSTLPDFLPLGSCR